MEASNPRDKISPKFLDPKQEEDTKATPGNTNYWLFCWIGSTLKPRIKMWSLYMYAFRRPQDKTTCAIDVEVYSLKASSSRTADTLTYSRAAVCVSNFHGCPVLRGGAVSSCSFYDDSDISLDMSSEVIIRTQMPFTVYGSHKLLDFKHSLAPADEWIEVDGTRVDIWVLGEFGVKDSWNKLFSFNKLFVSITSDYHDDDDDDHYYSELLLYDTSTNQATILPIVGNHLELLTYRESLVLP